MNGSKWIFIIGLVACLPFRIWHKATNIDPITGFFLEKDITVSIFYGILALSLVLIICFSLFLLRNKKFSISANRALSVLSLAVGISIIANGGLELYESYSKLDPLNTLVPSIIMGTLFFISLFAGIVFIRLCIGYAKEDITNRGSYTFLIPIIWGLAHCVVMYIDYPQIADMPDRVLYLICLLSFTVFLVGQGRIMSDVNMDKGVCYVSGFGMVAAFSGILMVTGEVSALLKGFTLPIFDLILACFISLYSLVFSWSTAPMIKSRHREK